MIEVVNYRYNGNHMITYTCIESTCHTPDIYTALYVICISLKMFKGTKTVFPISSPSGPSQAPCRPPPPAAPPSSASTFLFSLSPLHSQIQSWAGRLWFGA